MVPLLGSTEMIQISKNTGTSPKALAVQVRNQWLLLDPQDFFPVFLSFADFFKINFFEKFFQEYDQCQTVWIQIRSDILSDLIWVQTVCESYQQTTLGDKKLMFVNIAKYIGVKVYTWMFAWTV